MMPADLLDVAAVIIDLDGTLLDTAPDLVTAANAMLRDMGERELPFDRVVSFVGKGADVLVHRALLDSLDGRAPPEQFEQARTIFMAHYTVENGRSSREFPGVRAGLQAMQHKGLRLACVTNKPMVFTQPLLDRTGLARFFSLVLGGDSLPAKKPDPLPMLHVCTHFGLAPAQVLAIGDSLNDAQAARAAGMPVFGVPYGYNEGRAPETLDVDRIVPSLEAAAALIRSRAGAA